MNGTESLATSRVMRFNIMADPEVRNALLLLDWEGLPPSSTGGLPQRSGVFFSKKCADSPIGLGFIAALIAAAESETNQHINTSTKETSHATHNDSPDH